MTDLGIFIPKDSALRRNVGRLAMRQDGTQWKAFYALPDTMEGAIYLGEVPVNIGKGRRDRFMQIMADVVADLIEAQCGKRPTMRRLSA